MHKHKNKEGLLYIIQLTYFPTQEGHFNLNYRKTAIYERPLCSGTGATALPSEILHPSLILCPKTSTPMSAIALTIKC
jgi:hypothetical protein